MKLKEIPYLLGFRPAPQTYGSEVIVFELPKEGRIQYARWLHPRESTKHLTQAAIDQLRAFLRPGDVAIDIGAHTGDSAIPIAFAVGPTGVVLALEPNPYVFPVLKRNSELNEERVRIVPLPFAATTEDGEVEFEYGDAGFCNGGLHENVSRWKHGLAFKLKVNGRNLAKFLHSEHPDLLPRIRYIKVDAEGYDLAVLLSVSEIIGRYHPFIRAEIFKWTQREKRERLLAFLQENGYTIWRVENEENYRGEIVARERATEWPHYDIFAVPPGSAAPNHQCASEG